uniref:ATP-dependent Lon protease n=1 Tax=Marseillevirus LCMAC102 TaxID=2506603 RepID=A0A481YSX7_9VIRU|nr:MAG: ATP-dependent Lon protease [Marseillevirus LCMAC102]
MTEKYNLRIRGSNIFFENFRSKIIEKDNSDCEYTPLTNTIPSDSDEESEESSSESEESSTESEESSAESENKDFLIFKNALKRVREDLEEDAIDEDLKPKLKRLRSKIAKDIPTITQILTAKIPESDQKQAIRLYDILQNTDPYTYEYDQLCKGIQQILSIKNEINPKDISRFEKEEKLLHAKIGDMDQNLKTKIFQLDADETTKARIYEMYLKLMSYPKTDSEYSSLKRKIVWAVSLPYRRMKLPENIMKNKSLDEINNYCGKIYNKLNTKLYGMLEVKERIIQIVNNRIYNPRTKAILALKGGPGVGKTAIAEALANSLELPFERISLGGMVDPSIFKGGDNTWVGSTPSILLQILKRMKYANGIILFDEVCKLRSEKGQEIQHALLHITDYIQNKEFQDLFLNEFPHDLSNIWFMFAMNDDKWIDSNLRDRLDIISVKKYTSSEIKKIIQLHLLPSALKDVGLEHNSCEITDSACNKLIDILNIQIEGSGLRCVEKELHKLISRLNMIRSQMRTDGKPSTFQLSYSLQDFNGFPYVINIETIERLVSRSKVEISYLSIYT